VEQGDGVVQYNLGMLYYKGYGVTQDYATARNWREEAAAQDNAWELYRIGVRYQNAQHSPEPQ
jgi:TPR repeat protein